MLFIITSLPPTQPNFIYLGPSEGGEKKSRAKGILGIETAPLLPPQNSYLYRFTLSLSLPPSLSLFLSFQISPFLSPVTTTLSHFPPRSDTERSIPIVGKKNSSILPETAPESPNPREHSSMQPRRSRFTELIDIPSTNSTCSSSSELSLDDVLRETEQKFSQNRVLSFWNGWDHVGSGLQRQHSMPRSWLRKRNTGEIPRNVFGPSKTPWF